LPQASKTKGNIYDLAQYFSILKPTVLSYATQYVRIWRSKRQDTDANKKISEGYCKGGQTEMKEPRVVIEGEI